MFLFVNASTRRQDYVSRDSGVQYSESHPTTDFFPGHALLYPLYPLHPPCAQPWKTCHEVDLVGGDYFTAQHPNEETGN
jgi:hypothetical protein